jgi:MoaA/NifB/PqqE/SkfB family radical SAM enzyme
MTRAVIELTNRCNLTCRHCPSGRHGGRDDLNMTVLERLCAQGHDQGIDEIAFTGGEPLLHRQFPEIPRCVAETGYRFGFVSNGWLVAERLNRILPYREQLTTITFSLDGGCEPTHDAQRGPGSFRRVLRAASACMMRDIPFSFNMALTRRNWREAEEVVNWGVKLGSVGVRFGHLMNTPSTASSSLDLSPGERIQVDLHLQALQAAYDFPIAMAPGGYTLELFPCQPLNDAELNLDWRGNLGLCCHLSGLGADDAPADVAGDLNRDELGELTVRLDDLRQRLKDHKTQHHANGRWHENDYFPCWYCARYFRKPEGVPGMLGKAR